MFKSILRSLPVIALSAGLLTGCGGRSIPMRDARAVLLAAPQAPTDLRAAIARAMQSRSFAAQSETPGVIVAEYGKGRVSLRVKITYTPTEYKIAYLDSDGLNYQTGPDGAPTISSRYDRLVRDLSAAIDDELGRPAREAREAEDEQRRHELAVRACVHFIDEGLSDDKWICSEAPLDRVQELALIAFFRFYGAVKATHDRVRGKRAATGYRGFTRV